MKTHFNFMKIKKIEVLFSKLGFYKKDIYKTEHLFKN
jgi:hypothetical protein